VTSARPSQVRVPAGLHLQSRFFAATRGAWQRLGNLESAAVREEMEAIPIRQPVYVSSLARAGTTIVTEMLERHPALTSHHYSDFPNVWTPYWRNYLLQRSRRNAPQAEERAHGDRIMISADSPEAVEEILWMHFFPESHIAGQDNTLGPQINRPRFERFYRDHIRKLLAVRERSRYLAKGNYNVARFAYIRKLFNDARFLVPYRNPVDHIASLVKQHRLFLREHEQDPRVGRQLALSGHFEFGPFRKAVHFGNDEDWRAVNRAWDAGREVEGWALYWAQTYRFLLRQLMADEALRASCLLFAYESLVRDSEAVIDRILAHCELDPEPFEEVRAHYVEHLTPPDYYRPDFGAGELAAIEEICGPVKAELDSKSRQ
jgi:hypothetical protein